MTDENMAQHLRMALQFAALSIRNDNPDNARKIIHQILDNIDDRWPEPADPVGLFNTGCRP